LCTPISDTCLPLGSTEPHAPTLLLRFINMPLFVVSEGYNIADLARADDGVLIWIVGTYINVFRVDTIS
jgi:hypothetical protein